MSTINPVYRMYTNCLNTLAELLIQLDFLKAAIENKKIDKHLIIESEAFEMDKDDYDNIE
jgi:hypothetical protein